MTTPDSNSIEKVSDLGKSPESVVKRWKLELKLADKRESVWRKKAFDIYKQYTPENPAANSFNILWTNTETLRQSVYNSLPQPDARRRYSDEDELGKAVGQVMTRSLEFAQDTYDFDGLIKGDVLSMLLAGRSISRVSYMPDIRQVSDKEENEDPAQEINETEGYEEIAWEQVICKRIQYEDFRILCAAKTWDEVTAIGFKHKFTRDDCTEKFGAEVGNKISLDSASDEEVKTSSAETQDLFKTADVWEIWDKDNKQVVWINESLQIPAKEQDDPMSLSGFFPIPRPLYAIENDQTLVPCALYTQYEVQAKELNKISKRIDKITEALRVRGIYDSTLGEISNLMKSADNEMIAAENVTALLERGGLDKAIWMMPIDVAAAVLKELYMQRDACKQIIYEITGIADIMRSASDPNETFGAQKIKTQWGTQRLQRMQKEVQRYIRDLIRLKAEIIAEKFQMETLEKMTLLQIPHQAELDKQYQQAMAQWQQQAMQMQQQMQMQMQRQQPGQPPAQQPQMPPQPQPDTQTITWEKVCDAMRNDATRTYRIDIETDSTLSATQDSDMQSLKDVMTGLSQIMSGFGPAVQQGAMDISMLRELMLVVCRRAKMGTAIEDVISKMKQPPPQGDPNAGAMQLEQAKGQVAIQIEQMKGSIADQKHQRESAINAQAEEHKAQLTAQLQAHEQEVQAQQNQHQNQMEAQRAQMQAQLDSQAEQQRIASEEGKSMMEDSFNRYKVDLEASTKIEVAEINKATTITAAQISAALKASEGDAVQDTKMRESDSMGALVSQLSRPKKIVRDESGKVIGLE